MTADWKVSVEQGSSDMWVFDPAAGFKQPADLTLKPDTFANAVNLTLSEEALEFSIVYGDGTGFNGWTTEQSVSLGQNVNPIDDQRIGVVSSLSGAEKDNPWDLQAYNGILGLGFSSNSAFTTSRFSDNRQLIVDPTYVSVFDNMNLLGPLPIFTVATDHTLLSEYDFGMYTIRGDRGLGADLYARRLPGRQKSRRRQERTSTSRSIRRHLGLCKRLYRGTRAPLSHMDGADSAMGIPDLGCGG